MMKSKVLLGYAAAVLLFGCQKADIVSPTGNNISQGVAKVQYKLRWFVHNEITGVMYCTSVTNGDCLDDVVVTRVMAPNIDNVWFAVLSGDRTRIITAFEGETAVLSKFMLAEDLQGVISGAYTVTGKAAQPGSTPERYLLIHKDGQLLTAYPLVDKP